jgi:hypothetical protein
MADKREWRRKKLPKTFYDVNAERESESERKIGFIIHQRAAAAAASVKLI